MRISTLSGDSSVISGIKPFMSTLTISKISVIIQYVNILVSLLIKRNRSELSEERTSSPNTKLKLFNVLTVGCIKTTGCVRPSALWIFFNVLVIFATVADEDAKRVNTSGPRVKNSIMNIDLEEELNRRRGKPSSIYKRNIMHGDVNIFTPFFGYHQPCWGMRVLERVGYKSVDSQFVSDHVFATRLFDDANVRQTFKDTLLMERRELLVTRHDIFYIADEDKTRVDDFILLISTMTHNEWFKKLTLQRNSESLLLKREKFYRLNFQQLLLLDMVCTLLRRCRLNQYGKSILLYAGNRLGLQSFTSSAVELLLHRLSKPVSGYIIPRRCGKTSFTTTLLALSLVCCPSASLKILYTAQKASLPADAMRTVRSNIDELIVLFNNSNRERFRAKEIVAARKNQPVKDYFVAAMAKRAADSEKEIVIEFYRLECSTRHINTATMRPVATNSFKAAAYVKSNTFRGDTFNFIVVDEAAFIPPKFYGEILPNLLLANAKMMAMSSQKVAQDNRAFVNIREVRIEHILTNVVEYVCPNHCLGIIRKDKYAFSTCLCSMFAQPSHININKKSRDILTALTPAKLRGDNDSVVNKADMLSEIGIVLPGLTEADLMLLSGNLTSVGLAVERGHAHLAHSRVNVIRDIISVADKYDPTVICYLDPTPKSAINGVDGTDRSMHALVFVTRRREDDETTYIVLCVEEFSSFHVPGQTFNSSEAMATVFAADIVMLTRIYGGFFKNIVLIPECNSFDMSNVWMYLGKIIHPGSNTYDLLTRNEVNVLAPCFLKHPLRERKRNARVVDCNEDWGEYEFERKRFRRDDNVVDRLLGVQQSSMGMQEERSHKQFKELVNEVNESNSSMEFGYRMKGDKMKRFLQFFTMIYNNPKKFGACVCIARDIFSLMLMKTKTPIVETLIERIDSLTLKKMSSRSKKITITGKSTQSGGKCNPDDMGVAFVMAISLFGEFVDIDKWDGNDRQLVGLLQ